MEASMSKILDLFLKEKGTKKMKMTKKKNKKMRLMDESDLQTIQKILLV